MKRKLNIQQLETRRLLTVDFAIRDLIRAPSSLAQFSQVDMDLDGDQDLLLGSAEWIEYTNTGPTGFSTSQNSFGAIGAQESIPIDVDNDGDPDVVVLASPDDIAASSLTLYTNDGGKLTQESIIESTDDAISGITSLDLDADGDLDLLYRRSGSQTHGLFWHENLDGKGLFSTALELGFDPLVPKPNLKIWETVFADIDQDGDIDFARLEAQNNGPVQLLWYENQGPNRFRQHILDSVFRHENLDEIVNGLHVHDFDLDGDRDIIAADNDGNLLLYRNHTAAFEKRVLATADQLKQVGSIALGDINTDGQIDIITTNPRAVWWFENQKGSVQGPAIVPAASGGSLIPPSLRPFNVKAAIPLDVEGDGDLDIIYSQQPINSRFNSRLVLLKNTNGFGNFATAGDFAAGESTEPLPPALSRTQEVDLDQDGDLDVIGLIPDNNRMGWQENLDGQTLGDVHRLSSTRGFIRFFVEDLDNNGAIDVIGIRGGTTNVRAFEFEQGRFVSRGLGEIPRYIRNVNSGLAPSFSFVDIDGDDDKDILLTVRQSSSAPGLMSWFENVAGEFDVRHEIGPSHFGNVVLDVDFDGDLDVFTYNRVFVGPRIDVRSLWYENLGPDANIWGRHDVSLNQLISGTADMDGDRDEDLIFSKRGFVNGLHQHDIFWLRNNDGRFFGQFLIGSHRSMTATDVRPLSIVDLNQDGALDVVAGFMGFNDNDRVAYFENDGAGTFKDETIVVAQVRGFDIEDFDGDSDLDIHIEPNWPPSNGVWLEAKFSLEDDTSNLVVDTKKTFSVSDLLENDSHLAIDLVIVEQPKHGTLTRDSESNLIYTPTPEFIGDDSFRYRGLAFADQLSDDIAEVRIEVFTTGDANGDKLVDPEDIEIVLESFGNQQQLGDFDGDGTVGFSDFLMLFALSPSDDAVEAVSQRPLRLLETDLLKNDSPFAASVEVAGLPEHGTLSRTRDGALTYLSADGYVGPDEFTYYVRDKNGVRSQSTATVSIHVGPLRGDANGDHRVDFADFTILAANLGTRREATLEDGDFNQDGAVNFGDFLILTEFFDA